MAAARQTAMRFGSIPAFIPTQSTGEASRLPGRQPVDDYALFEGQLARRPLIVEAVANQPAFAHSHIADPARGGARRVAADFCEREIANPSVKHSGKAVAAGSTGKINKGGQNGFPGQNLIVSFCPGELFVGRLVGI